jgi:fluoride ion exporter CrcB/FEX
MCVKKILIYSFIINTLACVIIGIILTVFEFTIKSDNPELIQILFRNIIVSVFIGTSSIISCMVLGRKKAYKEWHGYLAVFLIIGILKIWKTSK